MDNDLSSLHKRIDRLEDTIQLLIRQMNGSVTVANIEPSTNLRVFTTKQHAVIQMLYHNYSTDAMADMLDVSDGTVKVHVRAICKRMQFRSRTQIPQLYEEWMQSLSPDQYEVATGIPMGWAENPDTHKQVTERLRIKLR